MEEWESQLMSAGTVEYEQRTHSESQVVVEGEMSGNSL
jgi:hypothetical protein